MNAHYILSHDVDARISRSVASGTLASSRGKGAERRLPEAMACCALGDGSAPSSSWGRTSPLPRASSPAAPSSKSSSDGDEVQFAKPTPVRAAPKSRRSKGGRSSPTPKSGDSKSPTQSRMGKASARASAANAAMRREAAEEQLGTSVIADLDDDQIHAIRSLRDSPQLNVQRVDWATSSGGTLTPDSSEDLEWQSGLRSEWQAGRRMARASQRNADLLDTGEQPVSKQAQPQPHAVADDSEAQGSPPEQTAEATLW